MNVLLVVPWDQAFGGVASVVGNLARYLVKHGDTVTFLYPGGSERPRPRTTAWGFAGYDLNLRPPYVPDRPLRSSAAFLLRLLPTLRRLATLIRSQRIEVINIHYPLDLFVYFAVLRWFLPIKVVVSVHGADLFPDGQRPTAYSWPLRLLFRAADAVVAPSKAFLADSLAVLPRIADRGVAIHNGVDFEEVTGSGEPVSEASGVYILCIAAHNPKKALDVLLRAFAIVRGKHSELRLVLVGDGPLRKQHEDLARALSIERHVAFLGERGRPVVRTLLRHCHVFVLPSRSEPFGVAVAEALACRRPVVASAVGGIPEIIESGRSGLLVRADDPDALARAVLTLLGDDTLRQSLAEQGYARALEHFTSATMGARYERLYAELMRGELPTDVEGSRTTTTD